MLLLRYDVERWLMEFCSHLQFICVIFRMLSDVALSLGCTFFRADIKLKWLLDDNV